MRKFCFVQFHIGRKNEKVIHRILDGYHNSFDDVPSFFDIEDLPAHTPTPAVKKRLAKTKVGTIVQSGSYLGIGRYTNYLGILTLDETHPIYVREMEKRRIIEEIAQVRSKLSHNSLFCRLRDLERERDENQKEIKKALDS